MALLALLATAGCLDQFRGEGEESITIANRSDRAVEVIVRIRTVAGEIPVFTEDVVLAPGGSREYAMALRPGAHVLALTTSTGIDERFGVEIPTRGDTRWTLTVTSTGATLGRTE